MKRDEMADLTVFLAVAEARSFTGAAAKLGISQSALSQIVRRLEANLGLRLLTRTTRSVAPTEAGERLLETLGPAMEALDDRLSALSELRDKPAGAVRITTVEHAAETILWPAMAKLLPKYPDVNIEIINDYGLTDIVAERFDAGVRLGESVDKDMIAVRIAPEFRRAVVASPSYFSERSKPRTPHDLTEHVCINLRLPTYGGFYVWDFRKGGRELKVRVRGQVAFNSVTLMRQAALAGCGLALLPEDIVESDVRKGRLVSVLADWCSPLPGYHLYYPSRRHPSPAFALVVDALRYRAKP